LLLHTYLLSSAASVKLTTPQGRRINVFSRLFD
jgi:hypothetical protein